MQVFGLKALVNPTYEDMEVYLQNGQSSAWPYLRYVELYFDWINTFIDALCSKISDASGNAINLTLVTYPYDTSKLYLTDSKFVRTPADTSKVVAFSVPMFANHPHGTIVEDFQFSAKLPDSVKNLSYVLKFKSSIHYRFYILHIF